MATFLELNGESLEARGEEVVQIMLAVASGRCTWEQLEAWLRTHLAVRK